MTVAGIGQSQDGQVWEAARTLSTVIPFEIVEGNLKKTCNRGWKAALEACKQGKWTDLRRCKDPLGKLTEKWGKSLLTHSIEEGKHEWATNLIASKINLLGRDSDGNTALHLAAKNGDLRLVEALNFLKIDDLNEYGNTPLHYAVEFGHVDVVKALIRKGANPNIAEKLMQLQLNALGIAVVRGQKGVLEALIETKQCKLDEPFPGVGNLLHLAVYFHQTDLLKYLLQHYRGELHEQIEGQDTNGLTPLSLAASIGNVEAMGILMYHKAAIDTKDREGQCPIHHAAKALDPDCIELLAHYGARLDPVDHEGNRPIDFLKVRDHEDAILCTNLIENLRNEVRARKSLPTPHLHPPQNLVFRGGGPKGIAYVGALNCLHEQKLLKTVERIAGTSAGAITATLLAIDYPMDKLATLLKETNLMTFLDHPLSGKKLHAEMKQRSSGIGKAVKTAFETFKKITNPVGSITDAIKGLYHCTGICEGEAFREWFEDVITEQIIETEKKLGSKTLEEFKYLTFGQLDELIKKGRPYKHLTVFGTRIDKKKPEIMEFSSLDPQWKDVIISDAIRISMSIPGVFKPHVIHIKLNGQRIPAPQHGQFLDGGMLNNFPIETFDRKRFFTRSDLGEKANDIKHNPRTLGFTLYSSLEEQPVDPKKVDTVGKLITSIAHVYLDAENAIRKLHGQNSERVIEIDVKDVGTLSFNMDDDKKDELVASGMQATQQFLESRSLIEPPALIIPSGSEVAFGNEVWKKHYEGISNLPSMPQELDDFLRSPCTIWTGKKKFQTHIVACIPKITLQKFVSLHPKALEAPLFKIGEDLEEDFDSIESKAEAPYWIAFTRNTIPGSYKKTFAQRLNLLEQYDGYRPPTLLEAAICSALEYLENRQRIFSENQPTWMQWTQCTETLFGDPCCVGKTDHQGIGIFTYAGRAYGGLAAVRTF